MTGIRALHRRLDRLSPLQPPPATDEAPLRAIQYVLEAAQAEGEGDPARAAHLCERGWAMATEAAWHRTTERIERIIAEERAHCPACGESDQDIIAASVKIEGGEER